MIDELLTNEEMRKLENEKMRKLENEVEATRNALAEGLSVYSTLPKVRAAQAKTLAKCVPLKGTLLSYRKETEKFGRRLRGDLEKKGCKKGGVSL